MFYLSHHIFLFAFAQFFNVILDYIWTGKKVNQQVDGSALITFCSSISIYDCMLWSFFITLRDGAFNLDFKLENKL